MRLGVSLNSVINFGKGFPFSPELHLPLLESSAVEDLEMGPPTEKEALEWLEWVERFFQGSRLRLWSLHAPAKHELFSSLDENARCRAMEEVRRTIEIAGRLSAHIVVLHASDEPIPKHERSKRMARAKEGLRELIPVARRSNVTLALELLPRTCLGNSVSELEALLEGLPQEHIGVCLDTNHVKDASSLPEVIHDLGRRLITLHISDFDGSDERHWLPGRGVIDWPAVWRALEEVGYDGPWLYESGAVYDDPVANIHLIEENFRHWRSLAEGK